MQNVVRADAIICNPDSLASMSSRKQYSMNTGSMNKPIKAYLETHDENVESVVFGSHSFHEVTMAYPMRYIRLLFVIKFIYL